MLQRLSAELKTGAEFASLEPQAKAALLAAGFEEVEYLSLNSTEDLSPGDRADGPARLFAAAWMEGIRLIDNVSVN